MQPHRRAQRAVAGASLRAQVKPNHLFKRKPMRPTDEEIEQQAFNWNHFLKDKKDFELGSKFARDCDTWYYVEDGDFPGKEGTYLVKICYDGREIYKTAEWWYPGGFKDSVYNFIVGSYDEKDIVAWKEIFEPKR